MWRQQSRWAGLLCASRAGLLIFHSPLTPAAARSQLLQESIAREPSSTPAKWMYMGQLREGKEAVDCYQRGIDVLNRMRAKTKVRLGGCFALARRPR